MGLWHGASWRYAIWGIINGMLILIHRIFKSLNIFKFKNINLKIALSWIFTLLPIMSSWIYFRSTSWNQANYLFSKLFILNDFNLGLRENYYIFVFIFAIITFSAGFLWKLNIISRIKQLSFVQVLFSSFALSLALIFINRENAFIYFQF